MASDSIRSSDKSPVSKNISDDLTANPLAANPLADNHVPIEHVPIETASGESTPAKSKDANSKDKAPSPAKDASSPKLTELVRLFYERTGYEFVNHGLLLSALTHASGAQHRLASNERLEFLGDAILGAIVCEILFTRYPEYLEGDLTKIKSVVVSRSTLSKLSDEAKLQDFLILGKGMTTHAEVPPSLLADMFESLIAAIYLDGGHDAARAFIVPRIEPEIEFAATGESALNYKSTLQQLSQREFGQTPIYHLLDEKGPDHSKCFKIAAQIGKTRYTPAWGKNKKEAEQRAARNAMCEIKNEVPPYAADG